MAKTHEFGIWKKCARPIPQDKISFINLNLATTAQIIRQRASEYPNFASAEVYPRLKIAARSSIVYLYKARELSGGLDLGFDTAH